MLMPFMRGGFLSGLGTIPALAVAGAVTAASVTATGEVKAETLWATKAPGANVVQVKLGDGDSGIGESADDTIHHVIVATARLSLSAAVLAVVNAATVGETLGVTGVATFAPGAVGAPSITFAGRPTDGIYSASAGLVGIGGGGIQGLSTGSGQTNFNGFTYTTGIHYIGESSTPGALANTSILYSIDVATKTASRVMNGAAGTVTTFGIEV